MSLKLKIKSKHLAEEAKIIRFEENKLLKQAAWSRKYQGHYDASQLESKYRYLRQHRKEDVGMENRATFLARAYIDGKSYKTVEQKVKNEYELIRFILPRICSMVAKYGPKIIQKEIWQGPVGDRKKAKNPDYIQLEKDIENWIKT